MYMARSLLAPPNPYITVCNNAKIVLTVNVAGTLYQGIWVLPNNLLSILRSMRLTGIFYLIEKYYSI